MTWPMVLFYAIGLVFGWMICNFLRRNRAEIRYVDTSGTTSRAYSDVWRGKTLNFKLSSRHDIVVPHVTVPDGIRFLETIATGLALMNMLAEQKGKTELDEKIIKMRSYSAYLDTVKALYNLTKPFAKLGYRIALYRRASKDFVWVLDVIEQVIDFYRAIDKKKKLLAQAETLRRTAGETSTWSGLKLDKDGKSCIEPRFGKLKSGSSGKVMPLRSQGKNSV